MVYIHETCHSTVAVVYVVCVCSQYEERDLRVQEERAQKRMEFENQKMRLTNQLEFERSRDTTCEFDWLSIAVSGWSEMNE